MNDGNRAKLKAVQAVAQKHDASINDVVLAYLINQPSQTIPIIGAFRKEQLEETVKGAGLKLSAEDVKALRA